jgi:aconitate hydratase
MVVCKAFEGRTADPSVSFEINPGSRQVIENVERAGGTLTLTHAGARIHQSGCLGCIGMGQAPATGTNSVRTFPRNFPGRSGTEKDSVFLASPETTAAAAFFGKITDPRKLGKYPRVEEPERYMFNEALITKPLTGEERKSVEIVRGPNITPFPEFEPLPESYEGVVLIKVEDNMTTDHIMPAGNEVLPLRSNIPLISEHTYERVDKGFSELCRQKGGGIVVGGENYGQGSSREHAAIAPRYLGVRIKIAKDFARIHRSNLINFGIVPMCFKDPGDYERINKGDGLSFPELKKTIEEGKNELTILLREKKITLKLNLTKRERNCILEGGLLNIVKKEKGL